MKTTTEYTDNDGIPEYLTDAQKNEQVNILFSYMESNNPEDEQNFKSLLWEINKDCRLFASHLELEIERHKEEPDVFTMDDVKSSCRAFRRESISNIFGFFNRMKKQKDSEKEINRMQFGDNILSSVKGKPQSNE